MSNSSATKTKCNVCCYCNVAQFLSFYLLNMDGKSRNKTTRSIKYLIFWFRLCKCETIWATTLCLKPKRKRKKKYCCHQFGVYCTVSYGLVLCVCVKEEKKRTKPRITAISRRNENNHSVVHVTNVRQPFRFYIFICTLILVKIITYH